MQKLAIPENDIDMALAVLSADELRRLVRVWLHEHEGPTRGHLAVSLITHAVRSGSGWMPTAIAEDEVGEILAFIRAAKHMGQAKPADVEEHLRRGSRAFLCKDYTLAHRIFRAVLRPLRSCEIDLGYEETLDEVLGIDAMDSAAQFVVSAYMLAQPSERAEMIRAAVEEARCIGNFRQPIAEMERVAVEPLPDMHGFLIQWRDLIGPKPDHENNQRWETEGDAWRREVLERLNGKGE